MALLASLAGVLVVPVVAVVVYADVTARAGRCGPSPSRPVTSAESLLPAVAGDALRHADLHWVKPAPEIASPREIPAVDVTVGLAVTGLALVGHVTVTRAAEE